MKPDRPLSREALQAIQEREARATPGPWTVREDDDHDHVLAAGSSLVIIECGEEDHDGPIFFDSQFIAHARTDIPALLATLDHATGFLPCGHPTPARITNADRDDDGECAWCIDRNALRATLAQVTCERDMMHEWLAALTATHTPGCPGGGALHTCDGDGDCCACACGGKARAMEEVHRVVTE